MRVLQLVLLLAACSFSANSSGHDGPSVGPGDASTGGSEAEASTVTSETSALESSSSSSSSGSESGVAVSSTDPAETSSGEVDCSGDTTIVAEFVPADLAAPMTFDAAPPPVGNYAYSTEADAGSVTFAFDVPCAGDYALWGLVHDADTEPFVDGGNADAFVVQVDDGAILEWSYGCTTLYQLDAWSYERVQVAAVLDCGAPERKIFRLEPGPHTVTFRNIEAGERDEEGPGSVAAIARVVVTDIEDYTPDPDLD